MRRTACFCFAIAMAMCRLQTLAAQQSMKVSFESQRNGFVVAADGVATPIVVEESAPATVRMAANCFAGDVKSVTGATPSLSASASAPIIILVGVVGHSALLDQLERSKKLPLADLRGKWESAWTAVVDAPFPGAQRALVIAGSDRRGAAFALFTLSRRMGVSPWTWWADVPVAHHATVVLQGRSELQPVPSVQYRGIFLNDEDWGLRPWAAKRMDPEVGNIGQHTYGHVFELLLRLHANTLWPAMHPGTTPFNAIAENARLADQWGIVMGSSHSEAMLRNNVGEWNETRDGPWNYQTNRAAIDAYWEQRLETNGRYENAYTVGMRGIHDTGLEAAGTPEVKARLLESVLAAQRAMLARHVNPDVRTVPQVLWLYKESLALYRAGMRVPDDVALGWTDDNFGYIRQMPTVKEQGRSGGSGLYYHVSYWGRPHDYLWLCTTPPALMREELTKAFDHGVRRYWILNVGDLKPAESDMDYFLELAWNEPATARLTQRQYLAGWLQEQFPETDTERMAGLMERFYAFNFVRKPEHMGFNGYDDEVRPTAFNPLAWGDENRTRMEQAVALGSEAERLAAAIEPAYRDAFFELVQYPVEAASEQNEKFLYADRSLLDQVEGRNQASDRAASREAYQQIGRLTARYNNVAGGKWAGIMSAAPRERHVFEAPAEAASVSQAALPAAWSAGSDNTTASAAEGFAEVKGTVSIHAAHFTGSSGTGPDRWRVMPELGISPGGSVAFGLPGLLAERPSPQAINEQTPWLEYGFAAGAASTPATLSVFLLPTFPVDADHGLRFAIALDGQPPKVIDAGRAGEWRDDGLAPVWEGNVLRNASVFTIQLGNISAGMHKLKVFALDPGLVFEHFVIARPGSAPAYPVPPETRKRTNDENSDD